MKPYNKQIIALDIQDDYVKCVQIKYSSNLWEIQKIRRKDIPHLDNTKDPFQTAHTIKSLLQEMGLYPSKNLVTSISGRDAAIKILKFPSLKNREAEEIDEMIRYELMDKLPVNIDQMGYDYQIMEKGYSQTIVLTTAAKRSLLNRHLELLSITGIYSQLVTTSSLALFNAFAGKHPDSIKDGCIGLISLRNTNGDLVICEDGCFTYARSFNYGAVGNGEQIVREIHNSFEAYALSRTEENRDSASQSYPISSIYLLTDGKLPDGLTEADLIKISPEAQWKIQTTEDDLVFGLALAGADTNTVTPKPLNINLIKQIKNENVALREKAKKEKLIRLTPSITALFLLIVAGILWWQVFQAKEKLHFLQNLQKDSKQRVDSISNLDEIEKQLQDQTADIKRFAEGYTMISYRLYQINRTPPQSIWLKEVYIPEDNPSSRKKSKDKKTISELCVTGYAYQQSQIEEFITGLRQCDCFSNVKQENSSEVPLEGERVLEFTINLKSDLSHQEN